MRTYVIYYACWIEDTVMAHEEVLIKQLERKVVDGENLVEIVSKINNVNGVQKLQKKIKREVCFLLKV